MSVKDTLDKIVERHQDVIGAMVVANGDVKHNLESPYDVISVDLILETFSEMFEQTSILEDEGHDFGEVILDFASHSLIVRTIDSGVLAIMAPRLQRGQLIKLHVGLGIFAKAVQKAIEEDAAAPAIAPVAPPPVVEAAALDASEEEPRVKSPPVVLSQPTPEPIDFAHEEPGADDESSLGREYKRKNGGFRRTRQMLANRLQSTSAKVSEPTPKEPESPKVNADGVPLNEDGTPKKKKMYRGQVYYE